MFWNHLQVALRNVRRHKTYSMLNVIGLTVGMACCILIAQYVGYEMCHDEFHAKSDRIYRVIRETRARDGSTTFSLGTSGNLAPSLLQSYPEVEQVTRFWTTNSRMLVEGEATSAYGQMIGRIDEAFLEVFTFPFSRGNPETAFAEPFSMVVTEKVAREYFGDTDPIGKVVGFQDRSLAPNYTITGILEDLPDNSTVRFDCLITTVSEPGPIRIWNMWATTHSWRPVQTFILLRRGRSGCELEGKLPALMERHMGAGIRESNTYHLQPLSRTHLYSREDFGIDRFGDIQRVRTLVLVAIAILFIACTNYVSLTTARAIHRAQEVGIRKAAGAYQRQLIHQFLVESVCLAVLALPLALVLAHMALPSFAGFIGARLTPESTSLTPYLLAFALVVGLLSGSYPAFCLSSYRPAEVLGGSLSMSSKTPWFRKGLVTLQFGVSIALIIGTAVVYRQLSYMEVKDLGFDADQMVILPLFYESRQVPTNPADGLGRRHQVVKEAFTGHPNVMHATAVRDLPGLWGGPVRAVFPEGKLDGQRRMHVNEVDEAFFEVFGIKLVAGRSFSANAASDSTGAIVLNETAVRQLGWDSPIGKTLGFGERAHGTVVGVVEDFHHDSLRERIRPVAFRMRTSSLSYLALRIRPEDVQESIAFMRGQWQHFLPERPFRFFFLDEQIQDAYAGERRSARAASVFSGLAVLVACLGLLGLTAFTVEQHTREIGVRKVLGASSLSILALLSREPLTLVLVGNALAWPISYYLMTRWLEGYAYHAGISVLTFVTGGLLAGLVATMTISVAALRAARANPVDALRNA